MDGASNCFCLLQLRQQFEQQKLIKQRMEGDLLKSRRELTEAKTEKEGLLQQLSACCGFPPPEIVTQFAAYVWSSFFLLFLFPREYSAGLLNCP
jgi:hypothetical protein